MQCEPENPGQIFTSGKRFITAGAVIAYKKHRLKVMNYCVSTPEKVIVLQTSMQWKGDAEFNWL